MTSDSYILLTQEGHLIQSCLAQGLTDLRKSTVAEKGKFYTSSFQLSIGFERLMKTILVIRHMAENQLATPSLGQLKSHGHRLLHLFEAMKAIGDTMPESPLAGTANGATTHQILTILDQFARRTRYFNLDSLASAQATVDPLIDWCRVYKHILDNDITDKRKQRATAQAAMISAAIGSLISVVGHDLEKNELDIRAILHQPQLQDMAANYAVYYVICLIDPLREILSFVTDNARRVNIELGLPDAVPYMTEFLDWAWLNKPYILRKKRWP